MTPTPTPAAYELDVVLCDVSPKVSRRIVLSADATLLDLHDVLQAVFGWTDSHLFGFKAGGARIISENLEDAAPGDLLARDVRLRDIVPHRAEFEYTYDFGDNWVHDVRFVREIALEHALQSPICTAGQGQTPDDNCGGVSGWRKLRKSAQFQRAPRFNAREATADLAGAIRTARNVRESLR